MEGSSTCRCLLRDTVADHLGPVLKFLAFSPLVGLVATLIIWLLIAIFYTPLYIISFIITSTGAKLLFGVLLVLTLRMAGRSIAFPGSTMSMQRDVSLEYLKRVLTNLDSTSGAVIIFCNNLMHASRGRLHARDLQGLSLQLNEIWRSSLYVGRFGRWLQSRSVLHVPYV